MRHQLAAVYFNRRWTDSDSQISYGAYTTEQFRNAACYFDGILRGTEPANLPVQAPTRYELAINLKIAKALA